MSAVRTILVATDANEVFEEIDAALADSSTRVLRVRAGRDVLAAIRQVEPVLVVLDLQIGNMGGVAASLAIRNEESYGRLGPQKVLILLDRLADVFIAGEGHADGWLVKPLDALQVRRAAMDVLATSEGSEPEAPAGDPGPIDGDAVEADPDVSDDVAS